MPEKCETFRHFAFASGISHLVGVAPQPSCEEIPLTMRRTRTAAYFYFSYRLLTGDHGGARM